RKVTPRMSSFRLLLGEDAASLARASSSTHGPTTRPSRRKLVRPFVCDSVVIRSTFVPSRQPTLRRPCPEGADRPRDGKPPDFERKASWLGTSPGVVPPRRASAVRRGLPSRRRGVPRSFVGAHRRPPRP